MNKVLGLICWLLLAPFCLAQYSTSYTTSRQDISSYCTGSTNCWNLAGPRSYPVDGDIGWNGYNLWRNGDGSLATFSYTSHNWATVTMHDTNTKQIAVLDQANIYRLALSDGYCGSGPTWRTQKWNLRTSNWDSLTSSPDCEDMLKVGQDGLLMAIGATNANGGPILKWNGTGWTLYSTQLFNTLSVADASHMCAVTTGGYGTNVWVVTSAGGAFSKLAHQPPGTVYSCSVGKSPDGTYNLVASNGNVYIYDWTAQTWTKYYGFSINTGPGALVTRGKGMTFGIQSGGSGGGLYHLNLLTKAFTGTTGGSYNGCPVQTCPNSATHTDWIQVTLPGGLSGVRASETASPTTNMNVASVDFSGGCDPFTNNPNDPACTPTSIGDNHCDLSNTDLGQPQPDIPCVLTGIDGVGAWPRGSTVTVYFNDVGIPHTSCHSGDMGAACYLYNGISSWNFTERGITYSFGGVVTVDGTCNLPSADGVINIPCNAHYPFLIVQTDVPGQASAGDITNNPGSGLWGYTLIGLDIISASHNEQLTIGAHEEGHHHGLANCDNSGTLCSGAGPTTTVMWYQYESDQPTSPTVCDALWADFFDAFL